MAKTLKQLAAEVLAVQDACNLCGVALAFARAMIDLGEHTRGTDERNTHPISVLWADKIAHLTGTQTIGVERVLEAYTEVQALAAALTTQYVTSTETGEVVGVYDDYLRAVGQALKYGQAHDCVVALHRVGLDEKIEPGMTITMKGSIELINEGSVR